MSSSSVQHAARKATATAATTNSSSGSSDCSKRLQQELMSFMSAQDDTCSAFPSGDSLYHWVGTIKGADGTAYAGLTYRLSLGFGPEYPFKAPTVKFETGCYHPNVDPAGNICLDILKEKWSAAYSVKSILQSIQSLLGDANCDSPLNNHAAKLWELGQMSAEYREQVEKAHGGASCQS